MDPRGKRLAELLNRKYELTRKSGDADLEALKQSFSETRLGKVLPSVFGTEKFRQARARAKKLREELAQLNAEIKRV